MKKGEEIPNRRGPTVAFLMLRDGASSDFPSVLASTQIGIANGERHEGGYSFSAEGIEFILQLIDAPIPWSDLENMASRAFEWPDAEPVLRAHKAHLIVVAISETATPVEKAFRLSRMIAGLAAVLEIAGVLWGTKVISSGSHFARTISTAKITSLPLALWIRFDFVKTDGKLVAFTDGMAPLGQVEIEAETLSEARNEAIVFLFEFAHYLLTTGRTVRDGDTIGSSADEKIIVRFARSGLGRDEDVLHFSFPAIPQNRH